MNAPESSGAALANAFVLAAADADAAVTLADADGGSEASTTGAGARLHATASIAKRRSFLRRMNGDYSGFGFAASPTRITCSSPADKNFKRGPPSMLVTLMVPNDSRNACATCGIVSVSMIS